MATTLTSDEIASVDAAVEKFSSEKGLVLLRPHRACCKAFYFTIPSGCYALVSRHGADEEYTYPNGTKSIVWPPGLHFPHPPWVRVSNLVSQQAIVLDLPVKACKTKDNVTVNIDIALAFRIMGNTDLGEDPDLVRKFVHELKPRGLEQQLRDAQDEAVRALARSLTHTEIYGIRSGENLKHIQQSVIGASFQETKVVLVEEEKVEEGRELDSAVSSVGAEPTGRLGAAPVPTHRDETLVGRSDQEDRAAAKAARSVGADVTDYMKKRLNRQFMPQGVEILSIMIKSCCLPTEIRGQMEEKTKVISKNAQQRMFHQNNMQNTRMEEEVVTLLQTFEEKKLQEETAGIEKINTEKVKLNDAIAEAKKSEASIREEASAKIQKLRAENNLEVQRIISRKEETIATTRAEAEKEAAQLEATTMLEVETKLAEASLTAERNRADASRVLSSAEGVVAPYLAKKNAHTTNLKQMDVYRSLAHNQNLIISDTEDSDANLLVVAEAILADSANTGHLSRSAVMAQLSLMHRGSSGLFLHAD
mmetsp:Transcript_27822/g.50285  ORF Transcript_27822/g.50285 Transcript_27822/m.50285 type:complete len:534 (-) Transcript_27822:92-1693(-)|eukprot:CAMPEP_0201868748 /NCGR_PEP_ID=MMETSP0902-20130614/2505_1 /ASSEMBLY_ACC=CAM_ASM_000551 /TAXON_ID=420261 /ORGANISM="Thalassiosira antarctica, Strain CCMP982" /LENGTH=533 /DNA_ID=CAMNT_0048394125 /DNA_START=194 /DNA_END=1795 /DNA_ORIENTATION=+